MGMGEARLLDQPLEAVRLLQEAEAKARDAGYTALELVAQAEARHPLNRYRTGRAQRTPASLPTGWGMLALTTTYYAQACIGVGDVEAAENDAQRGRCMANVLLRGGRPDQTIEVLEHFPSNRMYPHVTGFVDGLRAQALSETGDRTGAHVAFERALTSARVRLSSGHSS